MKICIKIMKIIYNLIYMENNYIILLAIIDSLHDFQKLDKNLICFDKMISFIDNKINLLEIINYIFNDNIKSFFAKNIDSNKIKNQVCNKILSTFNKNKLNINDINNKIIENFNKLFDFTVNNNIIFNTLLSDNQKILLRLPLYYLIKNKFDSNIYIELIDFFINYMNLHIFDDDTIDNIKIKILFNLQIKEYYNVVYPLTYFDDTNIGLNISNFRFNILNLDKQYIDKARTSTIETYYNNYETGRISKNILIDDNHFLAFTVQDEIDKIDLLDCSFYLYKTRIICKYNNIEIKVISNNVGRNSSNDNYGIYQITLELIKIYEYCYNKINETNIIEDDIILSLFHDKINENKHILENNLFIEDLHLQLKNTYYNFKNDIKLALGCLVFLLFGAKRFGDWIQVQLSKKHYFILQTNDYYCNLYAYLIGAPVIIDKDIYNYIPPNNLDINDKIYKIISKNKIEKITDDKQLIYKGLRNIKTKNISRFYFDKYQKYKNKYIKLKNKIINNT